MVITVFILLILPVNFPEQLIQYQINTFWSLIYFLQVAVNTSTYTMG